MKCGIKLCLLFSFVLGGLITCASSPVPKPLSQREIFEGLRRPLRKLKEAGRFQELIACLERLKFKYPADYSLFEDLWEEAITGLLQERLDFLDKKEYGEALNRGESLEVLEVPFTPSQEEVIDLYLSEIKKESEGKARALIYHYLSKGYRVIDESLIISSKDMKPNSDYNIWLKGVLTLIVDQGIRMQSGIGVPTKVLGSAFLIDPNGYALTNYHIISSEVDKQYKGYSRLYARIPGSKGGRLKADVLGYSKDLDIALIKVYFPVEYYFNLWSDKDETIGIGQSVYALGSPLGLEQTITSGILSAHNRILLPIGDSFQLDAAVNQGNSGGPVISRQGEVLGMVFANIPQNEGLNFAISVDWLRLFLPFLYESGAVYSGWLGIAISENFQGLEVMHVVRGEPGEGILKVGDKLLSLNGRKLNSVLDYQKAILTSHSLIRLQWKRDDITCTALVLPKERPHEEPLELIFKRSSQEDFLSLLLGMTLEVGKKTFFYRQYRVTRVFPNLIGDELGVNSGDQIEVYNLKVDHKNGLVRLDLSIRRQITGFMELPFVIHLPLIYPYFI